MTLGTAESKCNVCQQAGARKSSGKTVQKTTHEAENKKLTETISGVIRANLTL